jgi:hypothetical protein
MRRQRRTKGEWEIILAAQQDSDLTAPEYCVKHNIHLQTFYARKCDINKKIAQTTSKLVKVLKPKPQSLSTTPSLTVVYQGITLNVDRTIEAKWLADVIKALAS